MKTISDEFLKEIMSDAKKLHTVSEKIVTEQKARVETPADITESSKTYLIEQILNMEKQIAHIKDIVGRL